MRLLGVIEKEGKEFLLLQEGYTFYVKKAEEVEQRFDNYYVLKNRDLKIGNEDKEGEGVFNFRYGPVTAGVAEAGIFNIRTYGERILSVNIDPSYKRRGIEKLMKGKKPVEALKLSESVCGNFAFSHSLAFARAVEDACNIGVEDKVKILRAIAIELERIYNHIHVIARLSKAAAQNVLTSHLEWLFEESLRINKLFSSNRFLKGINNIGGIEFLNSRNIVEIKKRVEFFKRKFEELYRHSLRSYNFIDRVYKTAVLNKDKALSIGITGPSLRACGVEEDLRRYEDVYKNLQVCLREDGDALARMEVRACEILKSCDIVCTFLDEVREEVSISQDAVNVDGFGIGAAESPTGLVVYYVELEGGVVDYVYISSPSVFGYKAFADSLVGFIFTDFSFALDSFGINFADCAR
ncbi:nickel-dependent hydrogenase large subunit [Hippea alviniae]|uniref:hydrogenase large subunit n=1 Tax=Hippea alviniae TaxID=1279027 RepID=UPI0003B488E2|nr:nickel-dependent hydrogenase large subunit [Hippea alviniae]